jgi:AraC-like DNA-binding protein
VGQLEFLTVDLAHQSLSPIAKQSDPYLYLKLIETGSMVLEQGQQMKRFSAGSIVLVDSAKPYRQTFAERTRMITVRIPKVGLRERGVRPDLPGPIAPNIAISDVRAFRDFIYTIARQNGATSANMRRRQSDHFLDLVDILLEDLPSSRARSGEATLFRAKRFIAQNLRSTDLTATLIASAAHVSETHLNRLFKIDGTSLMRYVWSCRIELAAELIERCKENPLRIQEIAYRCGFSTPAHFCRSFKTRYGVTPKDVLHGHAILSNVNSVLPLDDRASIVKTIDGMAN